MVLNKSSVVVLLAVTFAAGFVARSVFTPSVTLHAASDRVFELPTYPTPPGTPGPLQAPSRGQPALFCAHRAANAFHQTPV